MITVKEAVANALMFAQNVLEPRRFSSLQLEEVDRKEFGGKDVWLITLSLEGHLPVLGGRDYKTFEVDAETGEVRSMKIRDLAGSR